MIATSRLDARGRYERATDAWVDSTHVDAFTHTVRVTDAAGSVELSAVCTPSPGYDIRQASARADAAVADPDLVQDVTKLGGVRMVAGFARSLAGLCAERRGAALVIDAAIEVARLARQVTRLPADRTATLVPGAPVTCWELDTTGWVDLPNSCFTYTDAGRRLFDTRTVESPMTPDLYGPPLGARRVFVRNRLARLVRSGSRLHMFNALHDNVHGFDLHLEVDLARHVIVAADSVVSRLPYAGICTEPQGRVASLLGQSVDPGLKRRLGSLVGGSEGCGQLFDLVADLLKLVDVS
jgi:hypothetical protein